MPESYKSRLALPPRKLKSFMDKALEKVSVAEIAEICNCSERTIRDWRRGKFRISSDAAKAISSRLRIPNLDSSYEVDVYAHTANAGSLGGKALIKKYGKLPISEEYRKEKWREWWESDGKLREIPLLSSKSVFIPRKSSVLAEFMGIMMGDGGISKYQISITLHQNDDHAYSAFVAEMINRLFKVVPSIYKRKDSLAMALVVSRIELVQYLQSLGLPIGNKIRQQIQIPLWIQEELRYAKACVRGLIDTDGCVFTHRYKSKDKWYAYKKIQFTSASPALREGVAHILTELGFSPRITGSDVRIDRKEDVEKYFKLIGSNNPKHWKRYRNAVG